MPSTLRCMAFILFHLPLISTIQERPDGDGAPYSPNTWLSELEGRPIVLHSKADVVLNRAVDISLLRSAHPSERLKSGIRSTEPDSIVARLPYLIRVERPITRGFLINIFSEAGKANVKYLPHDSYVAMLSKDAVERLATVKGVADIFHMPGVVKVQPILYPILDRNSDSGKHPSSKHQIMRRKHVAEGESGDAENRLRSAMGKDSTKLRLIVGNHTGEEQRLLLERIKMTSASEDFSNHATFTWVSFKKIEVEVENESLDALVVWLAEQSWVLYVGVTEKYYPNNYYGVRGFQQSCDGDCWSSLQASCSSASSCGNMPATTTPIWDTANGVTVNGLKGQGQVIGVADSGVDVNHCFFQDSGQSVSKCTGEI